jgi:enoyl-CoA hydratase/carnithine racemase
MSDAPVLVERSGGKVTITLNRPEVVNALNSEMFHIINGALDEAEKSADINVVVFQGNGDRGFCSGLDRNAIAGPVSLGDYIYPLGRRVDRFPKPVVSLIHGHVIAAGCQLATAGNLIIAGESLKIRDFEVRSTKFGDDDYPARLLRRMGTLRLQTFLLTIDTFSAHQAQELGLVSMVVPDDQLREVGHRYADQIAGFKPDGVRYTLGLIDRLSRGVEEVKDYVPFGENAPRPPSRG